MSQAWDQISTTGLNATVPVEFTPLVNDAIAPAFQRLTPADRAHLIEVADRLRDAGWDRDVVSAGLLHDIGKAVPGTRISVVDRGFWVILQRVMPSLTKRLAARPNRPWIGAGVWALARHAKTGAAMLAAAGYDDRTCWLVRYHERTDLDDLSLQALIAADCDRLPPTPVAR